MFRGRLHKSSIVIGLLVALLLVLLNIPGRLVDHQTSTGNTFEHGWPFVFLRRLTDEPGTVVEYLGKPISVAFAPVWLTRRDAVQYLPMWGIPWLSAVNWQFWEADVKKGLRIGTGEHQRSCWTLGSRSSFSSPRLPRGKSADAGALGYFALRCLT